jgi:hypothetical protein
MHGFLCAQTAISQGTSDNRERATNLGRLTAAYTVGSAVGPALGGALGWELSAQFAIAGSFVSALLVLLFPLEPINLASPATGAAAAAAAAAAPSSSSSRGSSSGGSSGGHGGGSSLGKLASILGRTWSVLAVKLVTGFANAMQSTVMPLILKREGMLEQEMGLMMSAMRAGNAITNGFMLGFVTRLMRGVSGVISLCLGLPVVLYLVVVASQQLPGVAEALPVMCVCYNRRIMW